MDNQIRSTVRKPQIERRYIEDIKRLHDEYGDEIPCPFCKQLSERRIIHETDSMIITENDYPYYFFDGNVVRGHLLLIPRRHLQTMREMSRQEMADYSELITHYCTEGYSILTRSAIDLNRTVPDHLHTHLLFYENTSPMPA